MLVVGRKGREAGREQGDDIVIEKTEETERMVPRDQST